MTQLPTPPPPVRWSPPSSQPGRIPPAAPVPPKPLAELFEGTPGRMRGYLIALAIASLLFGIAASQGFKQSDGALTRAEANAAQLIRIQEIHINLVAANADATNAFLVGGLEPPERRRHYDESLASAARLIAAASTAQPADREALGELNTKLIRYQDLVSQARANNRQALPIGSQYLKDANTVVQLDMLPLLNSLSQSNRDRVAQEFDGVGDGQGWLITAGLVTLFLFGVSLRWLARRTHRYLNLPIAAGGAVVLLTTLVGGTALSSAETAASTTQEITYTETSALSSARIAAYDARSNESLTLIARGSGEAYEAAWTKSAQEVDKQLRRLPRALAVELERYWLEYRNAHADVREADDIDGDWDKAVGLAIGDGEPNATKTFAAFDQTSENRLTTRADDVKTELTEAREVLPPIGWLGIPLGLAAALLAGWGMSQRLQEYR